MTDESNTFEIGSEAPWQPPTLYTARLLLRPIHIDDLEELFEIDSNPNMTRFTLWDTHQTREDTRVFIESYAASRMVEKVPDPLVIVEKESGKIAGTLGCFWSSMPNGVMELGYNIAELFWGRGFAVESCEALIDYVFTHFDIERLQARVFADNERSARVADKLGMTYEGTLRSLIFHRSHFVDVRIYSLLRFEWELRQCT